MHATVAVAVPVVEPVVEPCVGLFVPAAEGLEVVGLLVSAMPGLQAVDERSAARAAAPSA